jgi:predicted TIM-barrel fold metal-dependent hydrolase
LLLLAEVAAQHDLLIDFHFDVVAEEMNLPKRFTTPPNPPVLQANLAAFEQLLSHNRKTKIVWAHAGSDFVGHWTVSLSQRMLERHPNLYMSLRLGGGMPRNQVLDSREEVKPEWVKLLSDFSDRFVIGGDQFFASPGLVGSGPGLRFAQVAAINRNRSIRFLASIQADLARKIGYENAMRLYKFKN